MANKQLAMRWACIIDHLMSISNVRAKKDIVSKINEVGGFSVSGPY